MEESENAWIEPEAICLSEGEKRRLKELEIQHNALQAMVDNTTAVARRKTLDNLAAMAMQGLCAAHEPLARGTMHHTEAAINMSVIVENAYDIAEKMLAESEKRK